MPFLPNPFDFTASMKPLDGYTNAQNDLLERALQLISEAMAEPVVPNPFAGAELLDQPQIHKAHDLQPGNRITSDGGRFGGTVLDVREVCTAAGRVQIHWDDGEITWTRPDMLALLNAPTEVAADRLERDIADLVRDTFKR